MIEAQVDVRDLIREKRIRLIRRMRSWLIHDEQVEYKTKAKGT